MLEFKAMAALAATALFCLFLDSDQRRRAWRALSSRRTDDLQRAAGQDDPPGA